MAIPQREEFLPPLRGSGFALCLAGKTLQSAFAPHIPQNWGIFLAIWGEGRIVCSFYSHFLLPGQEDDNVLHTLFTAVIPINCIYGKEHFPYKDHLVHGLLQNENCRLYSISMRKHLFPGLTGRDIKPAMEVPDVSQQRFEA